MSGRGGRGGGGSQTVRAVASALGIARHEMRSFQPQHIAEPPPLYPVVKRNVLPLEGDEQELTFMADMKQEITEAFQNSEYYLDKETKKGVQRYVDKYDTVEKTKFRPDFSRLPDELCWIKDKSEQSNKPKRKKLDPQAKKFLLDEKFRKLEENETTGDAEQQQQAESDDEKSETSEKSDQVDAEAVSEDEGEEDNDYISNYFDNGEGYGDAGSDENMDGDEY